MNSPHCHIALAPKPWMSRRLGFDSFLVLGTQQCMTVPSLRSVMVDRRPDLEKLDRWHQFFDSVKLKHFVIRNCAEKKNRGLCIGHVYGSPFLELDGDGFVCQCKKSRYWKVGCFVG